MALPPLDLLKSPFINIERKTTKQIDEVENRNKWKPTPNKEVYK